MPKSHHSQSGPVITRKVAEPQPASRAEQKMRLLHTIDYLEGKLADLDTFRQRDRKPNGLLYLKRRQRIIDRLHAASNKLSSFGE